jgi:hypothetical protein
MSAALSLSVIEELLGVTERWRMEYRKCVPEFARKPKPIALERSCSRR